MNESLKDEQQTKMNNKLRICVSLYIFGVIFGAIILNAQYQNIMESNCSNALSYSLVAGIATLCAAMFIMFAISHQWMEESVDYFGYIIISYIVIILYWFVLFISGLLDIKVFTNYDCNKNYPAIFVYDWIVFGISCIPIIMGIVYVIFASVRFFCFNEPPSEDIDDDYLLHEDKHIDIDINNVV